MPDSLFTWLSHLVNTSFLTALAGSFLWGVLSILLSPCHLTSIPLVVGYISQQRSQSAWEAFKISLTFSLGILATIAAIGGITASMGRMMGDIGKWGNYLVAAVFIVVGLYLLEVIQLDFPGIGLMRSSKKGLWGALALGLIFGIALGPCTFAFMAPVLAVTLFAPESSFLKNFMLLALYGVGHCLLIVLAGTFSSVLQRYLKWNERSRGVTIMKKICGLLVIAGAIYLVLN